MSTGPEPGSCGKAQHWRLRPLERKGAMGHRDMGLEPRPSWAARVRATVLRDSPGLGHRHPAPSSSQVRPADGHQHNSTSSSPKSRVLRQLYTLPEKGVRARVGTHPAPSILSRDRPTTPLPHKGQEGGAHRGLHSRPPCASRTQPSALSHHSCLLCLHVSCLTGTLLSSQGTGNRQRVLVCTHEAPNPIWSLDLREEACDSRGVGCGGGAPPGLGRGVCVATCRGPAWVQ